MELERLKRAWHRQPIDGAYARGGREMIEQVKKRMSVFHRRIFWRDVTETVAAVFVCGMFGAMGWFGGTLARIGATVVVLAAVGVVAVLHRARRRRSPNLEASVKDRLRGEIAAVDQQISLLRNVAYWYVAPLLGGGFLWALGMMLDLPLPEGASRSAVLFGGSVAIGLFLVAVGWVIWWINQVAVRKQLQPLREELAEGLGSLTDGAR